MKLNKVICPMKQIKYPCSASVCRIKTWLCIFGLISARRRETRTVFVPSGTRGTKTVLGSRRRAEISPKINNQVLILIITTKHLFYRNLRLQCASEGPRIVLESTYFVRLFRLLPVHFRNNFFAKLTCREIAS